MLEQIVEMKVYKFFLDMVECIFMDSKRVIEFFPNQKTQFNFPIPDTVSIFSGRI